MPRVPLQAWKMGVRLAQGIAHRSPLVHAYGLGQNIIAGRLRGRAIVFYVDSKPALETLRHEARIPAELALRFRGTTLRLPTDVQVLQSPQLDLQMDKVQGAEPGTYGWPIDRNRSMIAAHVTGEPGSFVELNGSPLGTVRQSLRPIGLDIAEVVHQDPDSFQSPWPDRMADRMPRFPQLADLDRNCSVWVRTQQRWEDVRLWGTGVGFTHPDLGPLKPQHLILTDYVTNGGDSGTLLLGWDCHPIGLLVGRLRWDGHAYSAFTTLALAMDLLP